LTAEPTPLDAYLAEQATLTPVDRFARCRSATLPDPGGGAWRDLVPLTRPLPGQQYAFAVDLDACTGCKACVTACHNLNGLDDGESFRSVGLLTGDDGARPFQQTVTSACHHCLEPACLNGCPTNAYEKDPVTGIVAHLEGRCLGCGYCTWMCPYEVPTFNPVRGVVRKCDMCQDRLAGGDAPACVQACPNRAISIEVVDVAAVAAEAVGATLVPTAPPSSLTRPTTSYRSEWGLPDGLAAAGGRPSHGGRHHLPLAVMLVLTQASAGAFALQVVWPRRPAALLALVLALGGLGASLAHLGKPRRAWRAVAGLRHSWLSREVAALGAFAAAALAAVAGGRGAAALAAVLGAAGVASSAMLYAATGRPPWRAAVTGPRFAFTALVGGAAVAVAAGGGRAEALLLAGAVVAKLGWEWVVARHRPEWLRVALAVVGGVVLPLAAGGSAPGAVVVGAVLAGELLERSSFFSAARWAGMPGANR
jgi:Fe-S-cluster-containing dehydrogenase component/DMSO reductase anchor subunit